MVGLAVVDARGRLFGRINVIDLVVLAVITGLLLLGLKLVFFPAPVKWVEVRGRVCDIGLPDEKYRPAECVWFFPQSLYNHIRAGEVMVDKKGVVVASIKSVELIPAGEKMRVMASIALKTQVDDNGELLFNKQPLKINEMMLFDSKTLAFTYIVSEVDGYMPPSRKVKTLVLSMKDVEPERADKIRAGVSEVGPDGSRIAEVVSRKEAPARMVVITDDGEVLERQHPINRDLNLTVRLAADEVFGKLYYKQSTPIKVGQDIEIITETINFRGTIIEIVE